MRSVLNMSRAWLLWSALIWMLWGIPCAQAGQVLNDALITRPFRHHVWQDVLTHYVDSQGEVDFVRLRAYPKRLNEYLDQLAIISPESDPTAFPTQEDKTAYWINAHNALALRIILDHYPIATLNEIPHFGQKHQYTLGGKFYTLKQIQAKVAAYRQDPQVLMGLTDYTLSSPPISSRAYEGKNLKSQVRQVWSSAVSNPRLVAFERTGPSCVHIKLSPMFQQYQTALFFASPQIQEARNASSDFDPEMHPGVFPPVNWNQVLQPYAPLDVHADLHKPCSQKVLFKPADKTLRQVRLLRS